jgi:hypothetical protein
MFHVKHHTHITTYTHITRRDAHHQHTSALSYQRRDRRQVHTHQHSQHQSPACKLPAHQQDYQPANYQHQPAGLWTTASISQRHQQDDPHITPYPLRFVKIFL